jgi:hypothetical protein
MPVSVQAESPGPSRSRGEVEDRSQPRHSAFGASIQLGWWEGPIFRSAAGLLKDISRCGAAALVEAAPPKGSPTLIRLNGILRSEWVEACVVEVTKNRWFRRVPRLARLQFVESCPYHVFQAAIDLLIQDCQAPDSESAAHEGRIRGTARVRNRTRRPGRQRSDTAS